MLIDPTWAPGIMSGWLEEGVHEDDADCEWDDTESEQDDTGHERSGPSDEKGNHDIEVCTHRVEQINNMLMNHDKATNPTINLSSACFGDDYRRSTYTCLASTPKGHKSEFIYLLSKRAPGHYSREVPHSSTSAPSNPAKRRTKYTIDSKRNPPRCSQGHV